MWGGGHQDAIRTGMWVCGELRGFDSPLWLMCRDTIWMRSDVIAAWKQEMGGVRQGGQEGVAE